MSIQLFSLLEGYKRFLSDNDFAVSSVEEYLAKLKRILGHFEEVGITDPSDLNQESIAVFETWMMDKNLKDKSREAYIGVFRSFTRYLHGEHLILFNVGERLRSPKKKGKVFKKIPSREKILDLIGSAESLRDSLIMKLLYVTGMRGAELASVRVCDIDLEDRQILVRGKAGHERLVYIPESMVMELRDFLEDIDHHLLFSGMTRLDFKTLVSKYCRRLGMKERGLHFLRYGCATHLYEEGANPRAIQTLLGHKQLSSTYEYIQPQTDYLREIHGRYHPINRMGM